MTEQEIMRKIFSGRIVELDWSTYLSYLGAKMFLFKMLNDREISDVEHTAFRQYLDDIERHYAESIYCITEPNTFKIVKELEKIGMKLAQTRIVSRVIINAAGLERESEAEND